MEFFREISLLLLAIFGNGWFWASYVSRLYSLPWREEILDRLRHLGEIGILLIPLLLVYSFFMEAASSPLLASNSNASLLSFSMMSGWAAVPWGISFAGLLMYGILQFQKLSCQQPAHYRMKSQQIVDTVAELGSVPAGQGRYQKLLQVPGNQAFTCELNEKQLVLSRLPAEFHQLRILHLSDLHFTGVLARSYYQLLLQRAVEMQPDLIVFTGDLIDDPELIDWLPETLGTMSAPLGCYYILGNHDWMLDVMSIRQQMQQLGWHDCQGNLQRIQRGNGVIWLGGDERPWMGSAADFSHVPEQDFRLLLSHTPDNIPWARKHQIDLMLSGHNHGGQIKLPLIGPLLAPSRYGVLFSDGQFYLAPTTLHVSRGVAGRHPLRLNCRPEITLLELLAPARG